MATFYTILKVMALLAVIIIPLAGPKRKKQKNVTEPGKFAVNEDGYLEYYTGKPVTAQPVQ